MEVDWGQIKSEFRNQNSNIYILLHVALILFCSKYHNMTYEKINLC